MGYALKALEPYATKAARTVLRGRKLPGPTILKKKYSIFDNNIDLKLNISYGQKSEIDSTILWIDNASI